MLVEWHLNALAPEQRLAGISLRHSLDLLRTHGCGGAPALLMHDEDPSNNFGRIPVPGLRELLERHKSALKATDNYNYTTVRHKG